MDIPSDLRGVFAPVLTPVDANLDLDVTRMASFCQGLLQEGCHGLVLFGTTSEATSFSATERIVALEGLLEAGIPAEKLLVGTGTPSISETASLSADAVRRGCAGVLVLPPFYYKDVSDDGLFDAYAQVIKRVDDDRLRLFLYHIPQVSGMAISFDLIERLTTAFPATVVGIKDSSGDWSHLSQILEKFPGFATFSGSERLLLKTLQHGGRGVISAVANTVADDIRNLYDNWQEEDAVKRQQDLWRVRDALAGSPLIPGLKALVAQSNGDPGWQRVRPPLTALSDGEREALLARMEEIRRT